MTRSKKQETRFTFYALHITFHAARSTQHVSRIALVCSFTFLLSLLVYGLTLAPGLTWAHYGADGGDLIAASFTGGVAHPPGYPLYLMLGRLVALLPVGSVAYRYNLFSASAAAVAAAVTAWTAHRLSGARYWGAAISGVSAGLGLAFAPLVWEQAVITEVYGLNALLSASTLALGTRVPRCPAHVFVLAAVLSLAVSHHLTLACFSPLVAIRLVQAGRELGWWEVAKVALAGTLIGFVPLAYLPLAARGPVVWGDPSTLAGLWWLVSGALYKGYAFGLPAAQMIPRVAVVARTLVTSFTLLGVAAGLLGVQALFQGDPPLTWAMLIAASASAIFAVGYLPADSRVYLIPLLVVFAAWIGVGWGQVFVHIRHRRLPVVAMLIGVVALLLPGLVLAHNWQIVSLDGDRAARDFVDGIIVEAPSQAIVITAEDRHTFALWVSAFVEQQRTDIIVVDQDMLRFDWYRATLRRDFPVLHVPESGDVNELIRQNVDRPACRPTGQPPPWLVCELI